MVQPGFQQAWDCSAHLSDQQNHLVAQHGDDPDDLSLTFTEFCSQIATHIPRQPIPPFGPRLHSNPEPHSSLFHHWYAGNAASPSFEPVCVDLLVNAVDAAWHFPANAPSVQSLLRPQLEPTAELNSAGILSGDINEQSFRPDLMHWPQAEPTAEPNITRILSGDIDEQSFHQDLMPWPQTEPTAEPNITQILSGGINEQSFHQDLVHWPQAEPTAEPNSILASSDYKPFPSLKQALTSRGALATPRPGDRHYNPRKSSRRCVRCWALRKPVFLFI